MEIDDAWKTHNYGVLIKNGAHFNELFFFPFFSWLWYTSTNINGIFLYNEP